ncbi:restriction endonuclease [Rhodococcus sp. NPDC049939]|uniref:restriction endonuclease n=1 Tax=Rhodococcus sp. NPDC049939 TaxID=3155511 RepID=UPI0033C77AEE
MTRIRTAADAESNAAKQMQRLGYGDATVLLGGAEGGIDVHSSSAYAQVKWRGDSAGRSNLQSLYGARGTSHGTKLLYFSGSGYTDEAVAYADEVGMALFRTEPDGETCPVGAHAPELVSAVRDSAVASDAPPPVALPSKPVSPARVLARSMGALATALLGAHWRLLGAVLCTIVLIVAPFGEGFVALRVVATILAVVGAPALWLLFIVHRRTKGR